MKGVSCDLVTSYHSVFKRGGGGDPVEECHAQVETWWEKERASGILSSAEILPFDASKVKIKLSGYWLWEKGRRVRATKRLAAGCWREAAQSSYTEDTFL